MKRRYYNGAWHDIYPKIDHDAIRIKTLCQINGIYRLDQLNTYQGANVKTKMGTEGKIYFSSAPEKGKIVIYVGKNEILTYPNNIEIINFF